MLFNFKSKNKIKINVISLIFLYLLHKMQIQSHYWYHLCKVTRSILSNIVMISTAFRLLLPFSGNIKQSLTVCIFSRKLHCIYKSISCFYKLGGINIIRTTEGQFNSQYTHAEIRNETFSIYDINTLQSHHNIRNIVKLQ